MVAAPTAVQSRPEARVFRVEELLAHARAGRIRVPTFQRMFKWEREDVQKLLDSIWRGYPIGTLLLWSKLGAAGLVTLGDLSFAVSEQSAWFVVDGQQRIVSLVSTLLQRGGRAATFDLYFDLLTAEVVPSRRAGVPATHLPLDRVVDSEDLLAWVDDHRAALTQDQVRLAIRVGKAVREYEILAYVVSVEDEGVVREIFERTNTTGKALNVSEVFHALHAPLDRQPAVTLRDVVERLRVRSMGDLDESHVLRSLLAIEGKDLAGDLQRQLAGIDLPAAVERVERAMDRVFGFLAQDAGIPHLRLLPYQSPLTVLSAYLERFPTPSTRARRLLTRWLWRGSASGELRGDGKGMRPALDAVRRSSNDEVAARDVLMTVTTQRPAWREGEPFNLRFARSRLAAIALVALRPHDLRTGEPLDVAALLASTEDLPRPIIPHRPTALSPEDAALYSSSGNRILHPAVDGGSVLPILLAASKQAQAEPPQVASPVASPHVLVSHAISADALTALRKGDRSSFLRLRRDKVDAETRRLVDSHAEWDHPDRVSIAALAIEGD
ncbi:MAG TPA: DUF262 domain-containing protein [Kofleriaceae bacterium]|nr:DUF262 domain-containing protein [Kofleriaceae bacterium]